MSIITNSLIDTALILILKLINLPSFWKAHEMVTIETTLFYYYLLHYPSTKYEHECKQSGIKPSELAYGEISYRILDKAFSKIPKIKKRLFIDLGCGKGKQVFYANRAYGLYAIGIDIVPTFIQTAKQLAKIKGFIKTKFVHKPLLHANLEKAGIVLVACTCFEKDTMIRLHKKLESVRPGCYIISISAPIKGKQFKPITDFPGFATWGRTHVYLQKKRSGPTKVHPVGVNSEPAKEKKHPPR